MYEFGEIESHLASQTLSAEGRRFASELQDALFALMAEGDVKLDRVAEQMGMTKISLRRKIQGYFDMQPSRYLMHIRLRESLRLMHRYPEYSIARIAYVCGFYDKVHFTHTFVKQFGMSPTRYIQTYMQNN